MFLRNNSWESAISRDTIASYYLESTGHISGNHLILSYLYMQQGSGTIAEN